MNLKQALDYSRGKLREKNVPESALEGEILLRHVLGIDRAFLFSHQEQIITPVQTDFLNIALKRRITGEPTAYITGHKEFFGLDFIVNKDVLIPRPETELLVEKALEFARNRRFKTIVDIGTGSGVIAVCLALNFTEVTIYATDISSAALEIASQNAARHGVADRISFVQGDMFERIPRKIDLIIANLPYVRESELKGGHLVYEPVQALNGGEDGLESLRRFCRGVVEKINSGGCIILEIGQGQAPAVSALLKEAMPAGKLEIYLDVAGIERTVALCLT